MDFSLSDEQRLLIDTVRRFIREELAPLEDEVETTGTLAPEKARAIPDSKEGSPRTPRGRPTDDPEGQAPRALLLLRS